MSRLYPVLSYCELVLPLLGPPAGPVIPSIFIAFVGACRLWSTDSLLDFCRIMPKALKAPLELGAGLTPLL